MKIINLEHGGGKTTALVNLMLLPGNEDVIYVAPTMHQAQRVAYEYARRVQPGVSRDRFISTSRLEGTRGNSSQRYVIDEIGGVIGSLIGGEVLAIAGTDEGP